MQRLLTPEFFYKAQARNELRACALLKNSVVMVHTYEEKVDKIIDSTLSQTQLWFQAKKKQ